MGGLRDAFTGATRAWGDTWKNITSVGGHFENDVSKFFENEVVNKADLRGAQVESVLSGLPYVGDFLKGIEGVSQYEDLYNRTGKVPAYPAIQSGGAGSLGHLAGTMSRKIEDGSHDLAEYYSGDRSLSEVFDNVNGVPLTKVTHPAIRKYGGN